MNDQLTDEAIANLRLRLGEIAKQPGFGTDFFVGVGIVINPTPKGNVERMMGVPCQLAEVVINEQGHALKNRWGKSTWEPS